ncbi:MAG: DUF2157 domain-containing protein [Drouetiella hepatica Uher 2000/2452]|jgi:uncharacterized membrane protein|uniref:DUF2157 domain-containing protein n=1 Tax=Drouetiella hepatica Uher 2000/2452 TaxID=904376 RepID=A0A951UNR3_9CYAN|nr:DUF2157 domain-containing protein [Drouetiella hepatica Uher 2000/2452]
MVTEKFRRQLRQESEKWWSEGLIDAALYDRLSERYQLQTLEKDASNRFVTILMGLGGILLGLAVITFVAANWQAWSRGFRVTLLLSLFVGVNAAGFYLWRSPTPGISQKSASQKPGYQKPGYQKLGHGLLLLGALILGANLALMSQMFHESGDFYELLLVWGLGVAMMAHGLRLVSLGILSLILIGLGYWLGWLDWTSGQASFPLQLLVMHMPLAIALIFIPLAHWSRSRVLFGLSALLIATALVLNFMPLISWGASASGWLMTIAFTLPSALLWSYPSRWRLTRSPRSLPPTFQPDSFSPIARKLAIASLSFSLYLFSFRGGWQDFMGVSNAARSALNWQPMVDALLFSLVAGLGWLELLQEKRRSRFQEKFLNSGIIAAILGLMAGVFILHFEVHPIAPVAILIFNILLFLLAIGLIRDGLALSDRQSFWVGMSLLVLGILSRMLEYDTGLLLKSVAFALCGVGVILSGLWFERKIVTRSPH